MRRQAAIPCRPALPAVFSISGVSFAPRRRERGMALLVALIVLVVVAILGAVAMRTAMFQNRISLNNQTANLVFEGAESGLGSALQIAMVNQAALSPTEDSAHIFNKAANSKGQRVCYTGGAASFDENTTLESGGGYTFSTPCDVITDSNVRVTTVVDRATTAGALEGFDVSSAENLLIRVRSTAEVPNTNIRTVHVQEWGIMSPGGGKH